MGFEVTRGGISGVGGNKKGYKLGLEVTRVGISGVGLWR